MHSPLHHLNSSGWIRTSSSMKILVILRPFQYYPLRSRMRTTLHPQPQSLPMLCRPHQTSLLQLLAISNLLRFCEYSVHPSCWVEELMYGSQRKKQRTSIWCGRTRGFLKVEKTLSIDTWKSSDPISSNMGKTTRLRDSPFIYLFSRLVFAGSIQLKCIELFCRTRCLLDP